MGNRSQSICRCPVNAYSDSIEILGGKYGIFVGFFCCFFGWFNHGTIFRGKVEFLHEQFGPQDNLFIGGKLQFS